MRKLIQTSGIIPVLILLAWLVLPQGVACHDSFGFYDYTVTVLDENNLPLPGVNVFNDDYKKVATTTDTLGRAILKDLKFADEVNFTYVGYVPLKLPFHEIRRLSGIVRMKPTARELAEVVIIGRRDDTPDKVPYAHNQVDKEQISFNEAQTTADALAQNGGLYVQKSQMGGGSPIIRGFEANRVLLVVDGVRMNNAIYRGGHLQNAITIDNSMLERIEVILGPGSLTYGSDALGGVVHFRSQDPRLNFDRTPGSYRLESNFMTRFASANTEKSVHANINYGKNKWASLSSITFVDYDDLRAGANRPEGYGEFGRRRYFVRRVDGDDQVVENVILKKDSTFTDNSNVQIGTAYSQIDILQKIKYQPSLHLSHVLNFQFSTSTDVPRYDNLAETRSSDPKDLKFAEWYYGPQKRLLASLKTRLTKPSAFYNRVTFIGAFQRVDEDRLNRRLNRSQRNFNLEDVWIYSLTGDFDKYLDEKGFSQLMYGFELNHNKVRSSAGKVKLSDESIDKNLITRYPGGNNKISFAAVYGNYRWSTKDSVIAVQGGLRYTYAHLFSSFTNDSIIIWPQEYIDPGVGSRHGDLTWSAGITVDTRGGFQLRALGSKAFRSPNLDDFSQIREQNGFITIPNPDLKPENTYNAELTLGQAFGNVEKGDAVAGRIGATAYYTWLENVIVRRSFPLPDGSFFVLMEGDSLETQGKVNAENGYVYGWAGQASLQVGKNWELAADVHFTKGRNSFIRKDDAGQVLIDTLVPAGHIPPVYGNASLTYTGKKFKVSFVAHHSGRKPKSEYSVEDVVYGPNGELVLRQQGTEDNFEQSYLRTTADGSQERVGMLAWTTYNLYTSWSLLKNLTLNFAVENLTDLHYRSFSSGVSGAGHNFIVSLRASFGNKKS
jgi:hemoglobin/transferrin/lactoferrin receptor protein